MKILEVNKYYYPWLGGIETIVQQLAEGLGVFPGIETEVLCCAPDNHEIREQINGISVTRAKTWCVFFKMPMSWSFFKHFKKMAQKADIIDLHHPYPWSFLAYIWYRPQGRLVVHYHSDIIKQRVSGFLIRPLINLVLRRAERIIISNPNLLASSLILAHHKEKCVVIPFGVDREALLQTISSAEVEKLKNKFGKFVLFVGRLSYYKGVEYLIEAMKELSFPLVIIGTGKEEKRMKELVHTLHMDDRVYILPPQPPEMLYNFFKAAEVLVLPSIHKSEAFGIVLLEAMACGTPVISTELGTGTSFVNADKISGLVVPPRDSRSLRKAIEDILNNEPVRKKYGQEAVERVDMMFSLKSMIEKHHKLFGQLINLEKDNS